MNALLCSTPDSVNIVYGDGTRQAVRSAIAMSEARSYIQGGKRLLSQNRRHGRFSQITQNPDGTPICEHVSHGNISAENLATAVEFRDDIWFLGLYGSESYSILHNASSGRSVMAESYLPFYFGVFAETRAGLLVHESAGEDFILNRELGWYAYKLYIGDLPVAPFEIAEGRSALYSTSYSCLYARDIRVAQPYELSAPCADSYAGIYSIDENVYIAHNGVISLYDERNNALVGTQFSAPPGIISFRPIRARV
jgi:hypothetical protein